MSLHSLISSKITILLDYFYYNNLQKIYNDSLDKIFNYNKIQIIKPDYFIYSQYYLIYLFLYYITNKNTILYSVSLHLIYINNLIFKNLFLKYNYEPNKNINFLRNTNYLLFNYLLYLKILFLKITFYKISLLISLISIFYTMYNINTIYNKRLKCIENKNDFNHFLKIIIITPNKKLIEQIIYNTRFFTYSNYLIFINILIYFV